MGQPEKLQRMNTDPVQIDLVPAQTVTRRRRMRVMVVVPSLAERQQRYPPTVTRIVTGLESCSAPQVSGRIDEPGCMQSQRQSQENSPQQNSPSANHKKRHPDDQQRDKVKVVQPTIVAILY